MIDRLRHSMRAMQILMKAQEVTANNLANINTTGFKASQLSFQAYMDELNGESISAVKINQTMDMSQGTLEKTGNPFDFAIQGPGFFEVQKDGQLLLRRSGHFKLNAQGFLVDEQGAGVMGRAGLIRIPALVNSNATQMGIEIDVAKDGIISVNGETYGQLTLVDVENYQEIEHRSNSYFWAPEELKIQANQKSQIIQGYQEMGNVNALTEMVDMTQNMRLFESQQRAMRTTSEMLSQATTRLGKF